MKKEPITVLYIKAFTHNKDDAAASELKTYVTDIGAVRVCEKTGAIVDSYSTPVNTHPEGAHAMFNKELKRKWARLSHVGGIGLAEAYARLYEWLNCHGDHGLVVGVIENVDCELDALITGEEFDQSWANVLGWLPLQSARKIAPQPEARKSTGNETAKDRAVERAQNILLYRCALAHEEASVLLS